jgi:hypothetical protein
VLVVAPSSTFTSETTTRAPARQAGCLSDSGASIGCEYALPFQTSSRSPPHSRSPWLALPLSDVTLHLKQLIASCLYGDIRSMDRCARSLHRGSELPVSTALMTGSHPSGPCVPCSGQLATYKASTFPAFGG